MSDFTVRLKHLRDKKEHTQDNVVKIRDESLKNKIKVCEPDLVAIASLSKHFDISADYLLEIMNDFKSTLRNKQKPFILRKQKRP